MSYKLVLVILISIGSLTMQAENIYSFSYNNIEQKTESFSKYKGKTILLTNIATRCGYTSQLKGLETLYKKYKEKGLVVIGVPSNDFGQQTPETEKKIKDFCLMNYGVTFSLTTKYKVKGDGRADFISLMINSLDKKDIAWNFEKFLINSDGKVLKRFTSSEKPLGQEMINSIEEAFK